jgi:hypothetical protein
MWSFVTSFEKITFQRTQEFSNFSSGLVQAIVFEVEDRESIGGSAYGGQRAVCCTADLAKLGVCSEGEIIHRPSTKNPGWPQVFGVAFYADELVATLPSKSIQISRTGMYNLYFMHCDPNLKEVVVEGINTIWKNTSRMAPLMKFYGFMSPAFVMLGLLWFSQYARFWKEVFPLQNCITLVITLGMFEMAFWYSDYAEFNETGIRPTGIFLAFEVLELVENVGAVSDLSGKAKLFLVLPVAFLDAFIIIWIFKSLSATLSKLQVPGLPF